MNRGQIQNIPAERVYAVLHSRPAGLSAREVAERLRDIDPTLELTLMGEFLHPEAAEALVEHKRQMFLKHELEWVRRGPSARRTKSVDRIERYVASRLHRLPRYRQRRARAEHEQQQEAEDDEREVEQFGRDPDEVDRRRRSEDVAGGEQGRQPASQRRQHAPQRCLHRSERLYLRLFTTSERLCKLRLDFLLELFDTAHGVLLLWGSCLATGLSISKRTLSILGSR